MGTGKGKAATTSTSELTVEDVQNMAQAREGQVGGGRKEIVQDVLVPWVYQPPPVPSPDGGKPIESEKKVYHRYYHLFVAGELRKLVRDAATEDGMTVLEDENEHSEGDDGIGPDTRWMRIRGEGWEADNWWIEAEVGIGPITP